MNAGVMQTPCGPRRRLGRSRGDGLPKPGSLSEVRLECSSQVWYQAGATPGTEAIYSRGGNSRPFSTMVSDMKQKTSMAGTAVLSGLLLIFIFSGCSAEQGVTLGVTGDARLNLSLELQPFFVEYLRDLAAPGAQGGVVFDPQAIRAGFEAYRGVRVQDVRVEDDRRLTLSLSVVDLEELAGDELKLPELLSFLRSSQTPGSRVSGVTFRIDRGLVQALLGVTPFADSESIRYLLPGENQTVRAEDYTSDLVWIFEEYEESARLERVLEESAVVLEITVPRDITRVSGPGLERIAPRRARLRLPVIPLLTDVEPGTYRLEF